MRHRHNNWLRRRIQRRLGLKVTRCDPFDYSSGDISLCRACVNELWRPTEPAVASPELWAEIRAKLAEVVAERMQRRNELPPDGQKFTMSGFSGPDGKPQTFVSRKPR